MAGIRNDGMVANLAADFRRLYSPAHAWADTVAMAQMLPGLVGFWPGSVGAAAAVAYTARVYNSSGITISNATDTALTFNSERYDIGDLHSTVSNTSRLTAPVDGKYLITAHIRWQSNATGIRQTGIRLNGTTFIALTRYGSVTGTLFQSVSTVYELSATDYVEVVVNQNSGGDLAVESAAAQSPEFTMTRIA